MELKPKTMWTLVRKKDGRWWVNWLFKTKKEAKVEEGWCEEGEFEVKKVQIKIVK